MSQFIATHMQGQIEKLITFCAMGLALSFFTVALTIKAALVLSGSFGMRRTLRQRHCPSELIKRHSDKIAIPATGGLWMLIAQGLIFLLLMDRRDLMSWILILASLLFGAIGAFDDFAKLRHRSARKSPSSPLRDVSAKAKFFVQTALTLALLIPLTSENFSRGLARAMESESAVERIQDPLISNCIEDSAGERQQVRENVSCICANFFLPLREKAIFRTCGWQRMLALCFFAFVVIGSSNAVNLTDGLDGLAGGCSLLIAIALMIGAICSANESIAQRLHLPHIASAAQVAIYLSGVIGGLIGFLLFNHHPARIFMGDIGSLSLGASLGFAAILIRQEWLLACSGIALIAETLSVILQVISYRFRRGKRLFLCTPLHHHFECQGFGERKIVLSFWLLTSIFSAFGLILLFAPRG